MTITLTLRTTGGKMESLYSWPPGNLFLAITFMIVQGFKSEARPILKYMDPG